MLDKISNFNSKITGLHIDTGFTKPAKIAKTPDLEEVKNSSFKNMMSGMITNLNTDIEKPDTLLKEAMSGNSDVDVHDIMTAMSKAELNITVATNVVTKVIQAYDKISQIQV